MDNHWNGNDPRTRNTHGQAEGGGVPTPGANQSRTPRPQDVQGLIDQIITNQLGGTSRFRPPQRNGDGGGFNFNGTPVIPQPRARSPRTVPIPAILSQRPITPGTGALWTPPLTPGSRMQVPESSTSRREREIMPVPPPGRPPQPPPQAATPKSATETVPHSSTGNTAPVPVKRKIPPAPPPPQLSKLKISKHTTVTSSASIPKVIHNRGYGHRSRSPSPPSRRREREPPPERPSADHNRNAPRTPSSSSRPQEPRLLAGGATIERVTSLSKSNGQPGSLKTSDLSKSTRPPEQRQLPAGATITPVTRDRQAGSLHISRKSNSTNPKKMNFLPRSLQLQNLSHGPTSAQAGNSNDKNKNHVPKGPPGQGSPAHSSSSLTVSSNSRAATSTATGDGNMRQENPAKIKPATMRPIPVPSSAPRSSSSQTSKSSAGPSSNSSRTNSRERPSTFSLSRGTIASEERRGSTEQMPLIAMDLVMENNEAKATASSAPASVRDSIGSASSSDTAIFPGGSRREGVMETMRQALTLVRYSPEPESINAAETVAETSSSTCSTTMQIKPLEKDDIPDKPDSASTAQSNQLNNASDTATIDKPTSTMQTNQREIITITLDDDLTSAPAEIAFAPQSKAAAKFPEVMSTAPTPAEQPEPHSENVEPPPIIQPPVQPLLPSEMSAAPPGPPLPPCPGYFMLVRKPPKTKSVETQTDLPPEPPPVPAPPPQPLESVPGPPTPPLPRRRQHKKTYATATQQVEVDKTGDKINLNDLKEFPALNMNLPVGVMAAFTSSDEEAEPDDYEEEEEDWRTGRTMGERYLYMWMSPNYHKFHDAEFQVGPNREILTAHRYMLSVHSEYFARLFSTQRQRKVILFPNLDPDGMFAYLMFIYSGDVEITDAGLAFSLLQCAKMFDCVELTTRCSSYLSSKISTDNAILLWCHAKSREDERLEEIALDFINKNALFVLLSDGFLDLSEENLSQFLNYDDWFTDEMTVFSAVKRWATHKFHVNLDPAEERRELTGAELRETMGSTLHGIRFPLLSSKDLTAVNRKHKNLLQDSESNQLYQFISSSDEEIVDLTEPPAGFVARPRRRKFKEDVPSRPASTAGTEKEDDAAGDTSAAFNLIDLKVEPSQVQSFIDESIVDNQVVNMEEGDKEDEEGNENEVDTTQGQLDMGTTSRMDTEDVADNLSYVSIPSSYGHTDGSEVGCGEPPKKRQCRMESPMRLIQKSEPVVPIDSPAVASEESSDAGFQGAESEPVVLLSDYVAGLLWETEDAQAITTINRVLELRPPAARVFLPSLKTFRLNLECRRQFNCGSDLKSFVKRQFGKLGDILFFDLKERQDPTVGPEGERQVEAINLGNIIHEIVEGQVNVEIYFCGALIFRMCHESGTLVLNLLHDAQEIINACGNFQIKSLAVSECDLKSLEPIQKDRLEKIVMRRVKSFKNRAQFLEKCPALLEVSWNTMADEEICFIKHFKNPSKLALTKCKLSVLPSPTNPLPEGGLRLSDLYLDNCTFMKHDEVVPQLPNIFPYIKRVLIYGGKCDAFLLHHLMKMKFLEWILCWELTYNKSRVPKKRSAELKVESKLVQDKLIRIFGEQYAKQEKITFILERKKKEVAPGPSTRVSDEPSDDDWTGTKIVGKKYEVVSRLDFRHNSYHHFFTDYEVYSYFETTQKDVPKKKATLQSKMNEISNSTGSPSPTPTPSES